MDEEKLQKNIQVANSAASSTMIVELIAQLLLKGAMDDLILLILELQYIKNYQELDVVLPAFLEMVYDKIELIVEFKFLNPDALLKMIDEDLSVKKLMFKDATEGADDKPVLQESFMTFMFLMALCFLIFLVVMFVLTTNKRFKKQKQALIDMAVATLVWNGVLQSYTIGYFSYLN